MVYRIFLCDDNEEHLNILEEYIKNVLEDKQVSYTCSKTMSGMEAVEMYIKQKYDLVFMDIIMPGISGVDISKKIFGINPNAIIIYVTSSSDYAVNAFEQFAFYYLVKPINKEVLSIVFEKAFEKIEKNTLYVSENEFFVIKKNGKEVKVMNKDVLYFEKENNYINIYLENHENETVRMTLKELESIIDMEVYLRCHNGFVVNKSKIESVSRKEIGLFSTDIKIPVGRRYKKYIMSLFKVK